jgi:hypothetical protein
MLSGATVTVMGYPAKGGDKGGVADESCKGTFFHQWVLRQGWLMLATFLSE